MNLFLRILSKLQRCHNGFLNRLTTRQLEAQLGTVGKNLQVSYPVSTLGLENISIGDNFKAGERLKLRTFSNWEGHSFTPHIRIGNNVSIETDCHISAINRVEIGDGVLMASFVYISDHSHGKVTSEDFTTPPLERQLYSKGAIKIGNDVWLGEKVTVLPGVEIGEGSIIGANSVVTHNIPPHTIACGAPARPIHSNEEQK